MYIKSGSFRLSTTIFIMCMIVLFSATIINAGGYIENLAYQNFITAPAIGSNIIGYLIGEYISSESSAHIHLFVRRCECLKRVTYTDKGVFLTYIEPMTKEEFNALTPEVLLGRPDFDMRLTNILSDEPGLISVIERILEYNKTDSTRFAARISIKFVADLKQP